MNENVKYWGDGLKSLFSSFSSRDYRWLWIMTTLTNAGSWTYTLVVTWQAYKLTYSSFWSGAMMLAIFIPSIIAAPLAGVLSDAMERRRILFWATILQVIVTMVLAVLSQTRMMTTGWLLVLSFIFGFSSSGLNVLLSSFIPMTIPSEKLFNALSFQAMAQRGTEFIGPAIASPLLILYGSKMVYLLATFLYLLGSTSVFFLSKLDIQPEIKVGINKATFAPLLDGLVYLRRNPSMRIVFSQAGLHCVLTMAYMGILPQFIKYGMLGTEAFYGEMVSAVGLGSIIGTLLLASMKKAHSRDGLYWVTAVFSGGALALLAISNQIHLVNVHIVAISATAAIGASQTIFMTLGLGSVQMKVPELMRGRMTSFFLMLSGLFMSLANMGYGVLSSLLSTQWILGVIGILYMVIWCLRSRNTAIDSTVSM